MAILGQDIPQANNLDKVRQIVQAVQKGLTDVADISRACKLSKRHGAYYLGAARTLGWVAKSEEWQVTERGKQLLATRPYSEDESAVIKVSVRESRALADLADMLLGSSAPSIDAVETKIEEVSGLSKSTSRRRAQTLLSWRDRILYPQSVLFSDPLIDVTPQQRPTIHKKVNAEVTTLSVQAAGKPVLTRLRLIGFKNFRDADLPIGPLTLLVGPNAAGKSNIRDAFRFLHGIARGYTLAEIIGEKWIEGGALQWKGIRGGTKEASFQGAPSFALEAKFLASESGKNREGTYYIKVAIEAPELGAPKVLEERLSIEGRGEYVFDSHPEKGAPTQGDPFHLFVKLRKGFQKGFVGPTVGVINNRPAISQLLDHPEVKLGAVKDHIRLALAAFRSMRFLDLAPDSMRVPSLPGQTILGDRGENLSSVLFSLCRDPRLKKALVGWLRELTPLDAVDFDFPPDPAGRLLLVLVEGSGQRTSAYSASDGTLRFLAMIAALLGPEPADFYFFEELENGIYPTRLHLLLQLIQQQTARRACQVMATTHSPQLLGFLGAESRDAAILIYRQPSSREGGIKRIIEIPDARKVLARQDMARLHASGWFENAIAFALEHDVK